MNGVGVSSGAGGAGSTLGILEIWVCSGWCTSVVGISVVGIRTRYGVAP